MQRRREIMRLIERHQRRLAKLRESAAVSGLQTPPDVDIQIEDIEAEIDDLQAELEAMPQRDPVVDFLGTADSRVSPVWIYDLSVKVEELQERVRQLEAHEQAGLTIARAAAIAVFVVLVVLVSRYI